MRANIINAAARGDTCMRACAYTGGTKQSHAEVCTVADKHCNPVTLRLRGLSATVGTVGARNERRQNERNTGLYVRTRMRYIWRSAYGGYDAHTYGTYATGGGGIRIDRHVILFLSNVGQFTGEQRTRTEVRELVNSENLRECEVLQVECRSCF